MNLKDFTVPELDRFRELCNFTEDELRYFNLRSLNYTNVQIAFIMYISESQVSKLARKVKNKIMRVV